MAINKFGENLTFSVDNNILTPKQALNDKKIAIRFVKLAKKLKRVAPRAKDFLYLHAIMLHAAEASLIDQNTGEPILNKDGKATHGYFEDFTNGSGQKSVKWISPDNIKPYKNANGDIFGEGELIKSHKKWIGKSLCKDHKSESVDGIRGIIIDVYYDPKFKRVHALAALDKKNYGELARKVETGYANCVSMGTAVGRSVCTECGNVAVTEREYCKCIHAKSNYGEINLDLSPIELSLVVNGADGLARIKNIIASMNDYTQTKQARLDEMTAARCVNPAELQGMADVLSDMQKKLAGLMNLDKVAAIDEGEAKTLAQLTATYRDLKEAGATEAAEAVMARIKELAIDVKTEDSKPTDKTWPPMRPGPGGPSVSPMSGEGYEARTTTTPIGIEPSQRLASELHLLQSKIDNLSNGIKKTLAAKSGLSNEELRNRAKARRAYWLEM